MSTTRYVRPSKLCTNADFFFRPFRPGFGPEATSIRPRIQEITTTEWYSCWRARR